MQAVLVVAAFAIIVFSAIRRYPLYPGLFLGSVLLYLSRGSLAGVGGLAWKSLTDKTAIELTLSVALITFLSSMLSSASLMDRMTSGLNGLVRSPRFNIMAIPALIGGLPIAGGAAMSAPMVQEIGDRMGIPRPTLAAINLIFRHAFYLIMPFRPDIMLAASLSGLNVMRLAVLNGTVFIVWMTASYLRLFRHVAPAPAAPGGDRLQSLRQFLLFGSPILVPIALVVATGWPLPLALLLGAFIAVTLAVREGKLRWRWDDWMNRVDKPLVLTMMGIMAFRGAVAEVTIITEWMESLVNLGIPLWATASLIGGIVAFLSSSTQTGLAVALPVVIPLIPASAVPAHTMLVYVTVSLCYLVSPLHLCQILTNQMMNVRPGDVYREYVPALLLGLAAAVALFFVLA